MCIAKFPSYLFWSKFLGHNVEARMVYLDKCLPILAGELREFSLGVLSLTAKPFQYDVTNGLNNQKRYEDIGELISNYIYELLTEEPYCLEKIPLG